MKFMLNIVALPLLPLLLATMALTAPMRGDETIRDALPVSGPISERAAAPAAAAMVERRFRRSLFLRVGRVIREELF